MKLTDIILEGRKEDIKKQLLTKYPEAETLIDAALRSDPTGSKYIEYINRSFDDLYPVLKSWNRENDILDYFDNVGWWEKNYNKISVDDLDSIYEDAKGNNASSTLLSAISNIKPEQIKDINSWDIRLLKYVRDYINTKKSRREIEREAKAGAELVYETPNKQVLLFKIRTHAASCYYGANTRWCTTTKDSPGHFQRETQNYELYYLIDRTRQRQKLAIQIPHRKGSPIIVWKENDTKTNLSYLLDLYPEMEEYFGIGESNQSLTFLESLTIDEVKETSWWNVQYPDDMIDSVRVISQNNKEAIVITLKFEDAPNDFWDMWDIDEYDRSMIDNVLSHYGGSWEFHENYTTNEDWDEGYLWRYSSEKQDKEIKDLAVKLFPQYRQQLLTRKLEEMSPEFNKFLETVFDRAVGDIIGEITVSRNRESEGSVTNYLRDEYCNIFHNVGGEALNCFYKYAFTRDGLVKLLKTHPSDTIFGSLRSFVNSDEVAVDAPYNLSELAYNIWDKSDGDGENYYEYVEKRFDSLIEAMIDKLSDEDIGDFQERNEEYEKFMKFLDKRGIGLGTWYSLPADDQFIFRIDDIIFNESSVEVSVSSKDKTSIKKYEPSFEEFITLLYNYQLFR
jgi:hypothetical protein